MKTSTKEQLDSDYEYRIKYIIGLKNKIFLKILLLKIVFISLLFSMIYIPLYYDLFDIMNTYNYSLSNFLSPVLGLYLFVYLDLSIIQIILIYYDKFPYKHVLFILGVLILIGYERNLSIWILKFIGLILVYKLPDLTEKFNFYLKKYMGYKESYKELLGLDMTINRILVMYFLAIIIFVSSSYSVVIIYEFFSVQLGNEANFVLPIILLPIITVILYFSPFIFTSFKKLRWNDELYKPS